MVPRVSEVARIFLVAAFLVLVAQGPVFSGNSRNTSESLLAAAGQNCRNVTNPSGGISTVCDEPHADKEVKIGGGQAPKPETKITDECTQENIANWRKSGSVALQQKAQACENKKGTQTAEAPDGKKIDITCKEGDTCGAVTQGSGGASNPSAVQQYTDNKPYISQTPLTPPDAYTSDAINKAFPGVSDGTTPLAYPVATPKNPDSIGGALSSEVPGITLAPTQSLNESTLTDKVALSPSYAPPQSASLNGYSPITSGATLAQHSTGLVPNGPLWNSFAPLGGITPDMAHTFSPSEVFFAQQAPVASYALSGSKFPITVTDVSGKVVATFNGEDFGFTEQGFLNISTNQLAGLPLGSGTLSDRITHTLVNEMQSFGADGELARTLLASTDSSGKTLAENVGNAIAQNESQKGLLTRVWESLGSDGAPAQVTVKGSIHDTEGALSIAAQDYVQGPKAPSVDSGTAAVQNTGSANQGVLNQENNLIRDISQQSAPGTQAGSRPQSLMNSNNLQITANEQQGLPGTQSGADETRRPIAATVISQDEFNRLFPQRTPSAAEPDISRLAFVPPHMAQNLLMPLETIEVRTVPDVGTSYTNPPSAAPSETPGTPSVSRVRDTAPSISVSDSGPNKEEAVSEPRYPTPTRTLSNERPQEKEPVLRDSGPSDSANSIRIPNAVADTRPSSGVSGSDALQQTLTEHPLAQLYSATKKSVADNFRSALTQPSKYLNNAFSVEPLAQATEAVKDPLPKIVETVEGVASCYDPTHTTSCGGTKYEGGMLTATGKYVGDTQPTVALQLDKAKELGCGYAGKKCIALVTDTNTGKSVVATIDDNGPLFKGRVADLSSKTKEMLGSKGNPEVRIEIFAKGTTKEQVAQARAQKESPVVVSEQLSPTEKEERELQAEAKALGVPASMYEIPQKDTVVRTAAIPGPMFLGGPKETNTWSPEAWSARTPSVEQARVVIRDIANLYGADMKFDGDSFARSMSAVFQIETNGTPNAKNESNNRYEGSFQLGPDEYKKWIAQANTDVEKMRQKGIVSDAQAQIFRQVLADAARAGTDPRFNHLLNTWAALSEHARSEQNIQKTVPDPKLRAAFHQGVQLIPTQTKRVLAEGVDKVLGQASTKALAQNNIQGASTVMDAMKRMANGANGFAKKIQQGIASMGSIGVATAPTQQAVFKVRLGEAAISPSLSRVPTPQPTSLCIGSTNCNGINANNYINSLCQADRGCTAQNLGAQPDKTYPEHIMTNAAERAADYARQVAAAGKYSRGNQPILIDNCQYSGSCAEIRAAIQKWNAENPGNTLIPMVNNPLLVAEQLGQGAARDLMRAVAQMGGGAIVENGAGSLKENDAFRQAIGYASMPILALANPEGGKRLAEEIISNALNNIGTSISSEIEGGAGYRDGVAGLPIAFGVPETSIAERALTNYARGMGSVTANLTQENAESIRQQVESEAKQAVARAYQAAQLNGNPALAGVRRNGTLDVQENGAVYRTSPQGRAQVGTIERITPSQTSLASMPSRFFGAERFSGINPIIAHSMTEASKLLPPGYTAKVISASRVSSTVGSASFHLKRDEANNSLAVDVTLVSPTGQELKNLRAPQNFALYREFMQNVKAVQDQLYPNMQGLGRWGGYFVSGIAQDLMHYDLGPKNQTAAGNWENGLSPQYAFYGMPGDAGKGMGPIAAYKIPALAQPESYDEFKSTDGAVIAKLEPVKDIGDIKAKIIKDNDKLDIEIEYTPPIPPIVPEPTIAERAWNTVRNAVAPIQQKMQDMFKQLFGGMGQSGGSSGGGSQGGGKGGSTPAVPTTPPATPVQPVPTTPERGSLSCAPQTIVHKASTTPLTIAWRCPLGTTAEGIGFSTLGTNIGTTSLVVSTTSERALYGLRCSGAATPQTFSCAVRVLHPVVALVSRPDEVKTGESTLLRWNALDVQSCELYAPPSFIMMRGGMQGEATSLPLSQTSEFAVRCKAGESTWVSASTTVGVRGYTGHTLHVELPIE